MNRMEIVTPISSGFAGLYRAARAIGAQRPATRILVYPTGDAAMTRAFKQKHRDLVPIEYEPVLGGPFDVGLLVSEGLAIADADGWLCICDADVALPNSLFDLLPRLDRGCVYRPRLRVAPEPRDVHVQELWSFCQLYPGGDRPRCEFWWQSRSGKPTIGCDLDVLHLGPITGSCVTRTVDSTPWTVVEKAVQTFGFHSAG